MNNYNLRFCKVREVHSPTRAYSGDAGIDFYVPNLSLEDLVKVEVNRIAFGNDQLLVSSDKKIIMRPGSRILIPSGIRVLIEPSKSMLMAANKSGVATKRGLLYTAEIVDSAYTGEVHIGIFNSGSEEIELNIINHPGEKLVQFIHVPIYDTVPEEIPLSLYDEIASTWGNRGSKGFGSSDNK